MPHRLIPCPVCGLPTAIRSVVLRTHPREKRARTWSRVACFRGHRTVVAGELWTRSIRNGRPKTGAAA